MLVTSLPFSVKSSKKTTARNPLQFSNLMTTSKNKTTGRPPKPDSLASTSRRLTKELGFNVTVRAVREWSEKGYPLDNKEKLLDCLAAQQRIGGKETPKNLTDAKLAKLLVDIEAAKFRLEVERGKYTRNDLVQEQGVRIGAATRSELMRFKADVPNWAGLSSAEMERRCSKLIDSICKNLGDSLSKVYRK